MIFSLLKVSCISDSKRLLFLLSLILGVTAPTFGQIVLDSIPSPVGYDDPFRGYNSSPIVVGTDVYFRYQGDDGNYDLAKYDGTTLTIIDSPTDYDNSSRGYNGVPVLVGTDLYLRYQANDGSWDLAKYDGSTLTFIDSPSGHDGAGNGYYGDSFIMGTDLYLRYKGNDGNYDLAKYDGSILTIIDSPSGFTIEDGYLGDPIALGTDLYLRFQADDRVFDLLRYDGTNFTAVSRPSGYDGLGRGYFGDPVLLGTDLYLRYYDDNQNYDLVKYDGTNMTIIPSPTGYTNAFCGYNIDNTAVVVGTDLYLQYRGNDTNMDLAKYDGTTLTIIDSPAGYQGSNNRGYSGSLAVMGSDLYLRYQDDNYVGTLAKYDGTNLTFIDTPIGCNGNSKGYLGEPIVVGSDLYMQYLADDGNHDLAKYDGTNLTFIDSPVGYDAAEFFNGFSFTRYGYFGSPVAVGTDLYLRYHGNDGNYDLFMASPPPQSEFYVSTSGSDTNSGADFSNAYQTFQKALEEAEAFGVGAKVYVAAGTYKPSQQYDFTSGATSTAGSRYASFQVPDGVEVYGGFSGMETGTIDQAVLDARDLTANETILSGDFNDDDMVTGVGASLSITTNTENAYHVVYTKNVSSTTTVDGFTITGGNADGSGEDLYFGGGWYNCADGSAMTSNPKIRNCIFEKNDSRINGGGMVNHARILTTASPTYNNCSFIENYANNEAGALLNYGSNGESSPTVLNCIFMGNYGKNNAGAVFNYGSGPDGVSNATYTNCVFNKNASRQAGAMYNFALSGSASVTVTNCTFTENSATESGGAIRNLFAGSGNTVNVKIRNSIFWNNTATNADPTFNNTSAATTVDVAYTLVQDANSGAFSQTNTNGDLGMIYAQDPLFVDAANNNLSLSAGSPAINAGNNADVPMGVTTDLAGDSRIKGNTVDLGALEATPAPEIEFTPTPNDFGVVAIGTAETITYEIENTGSATLTVSTITSNAGMFTVSPTSSFEVSAGATASFEVTFTPSATGTTSATITITSNDADESVITFEVTGTGEIVPATALNFDGADDFVTFGNVNDFAIDEAFSGEAWIKVPPTVTSGTIFGKTETPALGGWALSLDGGAIQFALAQNLMTAFDLYNTSNPVNDDNWHHIAFTYDETGNVAMFVDGVSQTINFVDTDGSPTTNITNAGPLTIGSLNGFNYFEGTIDEVRIWSQERTAADIQNFKDIQLSGEECGLLAYYDFNQGQSSVNNTGLTILADASDGTQEGVLVSFGLTGTTSNWVDGTANGVSGTTTTTRSKIDFPFTMTDFGIVAVGTSRSISYQIENTGSEILFISDITSSNTSTFTLENVPSQIAAGGSATFEVVFTASSTGTSSATITINSDDCDNPSITLITTATGFVPGVALDFDGVNDVVLGTGINVA
ncbi:MAG: choice-of-anchor D domain-containing protein, partial [Bacteroidota bacterium]